MDPYLALLVLSHHDVHCKQELTRIGAGAGPCGKLGGGCGRQWGSGGYLHGSPGAEPLLMHIARELTGMGAGTGPHHSWFQGV